MLHGIIMHARTSNKPVNFRAKVPSHSPENGKQLLEIRFCRTYTGMTTHKT